MWIEDKSNKKAFDEVISRLSGIYTSDSIILDSTFESLGGKQNSWSSPKDDSPTDGLMANKENLKEGIFADTSGKFNDYFKKLNENQVNATPDIFKP